MKTFVKVLSMLVAVIMLVGVGTVGFSAYAVPSDVLGNYDFSVVDNPYEEIEWNNGTLHAFKSSTHAHTVRSDADIELNDTIWYHYMKGYEVLCLTDHGTVNGVSIKTTDANGKTWTTGATGANGASCGWTEDQDRCALYAYQSFVHGNIDEISTTDYYNIIAGQQVGTYGARPSELVSAGRGMFNLPLGNEANAVSGNKCHVNTYNVSVFHGATRNVEWPESTVQGAYNSNAITRINHIGEWTDGNGDPGVYDESWVNNFTKIFTSYCPNRTTYTESDDTWNTTNITGQRVKKGVVGIELVNTSDNRTRNDRFYVYDKSLMKLAPLGINMYGFCEDDSHEESDVDKNAQYFLVNDGTAWSSEDEDFYGGLYGTGSSNPTPWVGYTGDIIHSLANGEFYASSVNSKNSYELGDGFVASGNYPAMTYFNIDEVKDQITLTVTNSAKIRLVADGTIIDTKTITQSESETTIVFDLNSYENLINSYVRIYMTGKGGITYLQPILLEKELRAQSFVQFVLPSADTTLEVYDADKRLIDTEYYDNVYVLAPGEYSYKCTRRGYLTKEESFTVTQEDVESARERIITVTLDKDENVSYAYFYAPETIYLNPADNKTFLYYIDRENEDNGNLIVSPNKTSGNVYFHRSGATNVKITASFKEGASTLSSYNIGINSTTGDTIKTSITSGALSETISAGSYVLIVWQAEYEYEGKDYVTYTYSYVYPTPTGTSSTLSAGSRMVIDHSLNSALKVATSVFAYGLHKIESAQSTGYEYAPYYKDIAGRDNDPYVDGGSGYTFRTNETSGSSESAVSSSADHGYIYADKSRINNFNQVPLLQIGFDINSAEKADETDTTPYYNFYFAEASNVLASMSGTTLDDFDGKRIYISDNGSTDKDLDYAFVEQEETRYVVHGEAKGVHEVGPWLGEWMAQATSVSEVYITVIRTDKSNLRELYNTAVSNSYQQDWFSSIPEYNTYRESIIQAAKVLGNPAATPSDILSAEQNLSQTEDSAALIGGKYQVKHYWVYQNETGEIASEDIFDYILGDTLVANSTIFDGYDYAKRFERYAIISTTDAEGNVTEERKLVSEGTDVFETVTAAETKYEWIFYYVPITYKVDYNTGLVNFTPNGGSGSVALYNQDFTICTNSPTRTGYTFDGWYLDIDPSQRVYSSGETILYEYLENGQFTAKWVPLEYKVTFNLNGGTFKPGEEPTDEEKDVVFDEVYKLPIGVPVRTGYHFLGWQVNGSDEVHTAGSQFLWDWAADGELTAIWSNAEYTVSYDTCADDATVTPASNNIYYDKAYGTLATAQRTGYTYEWYSDANYPESSLVTSETIVKIPLDHTLYAKWTPIEYTINYTLDGGLVEGINPQVYNITCDEITLINPTKTGYAFAGWSGTGISETQYEDEVKIPTGSYGDRSYVAHWEAIDYTITYILNDDDPTVSKAVNSHNPTGFTYADAFSINPPVRTGYDFKGWTGGDYTSVQSIDVTAGTYAEDLTFEAEWEEIVYQISYDTRGGTLDISSPSQYTIENGATITKPPTRTGYTFFGWQSSNSDEISSNLIIEPGTYGDIFLTAIWASDEGEIIYELNGGSFLTQAPTKYETGDSFAIERPVRTGYTFANWTKYNVNSNKTQIVEDAYIVGEGDDPDSGTIVFTANWTPIEYSISYNLDGGHYESAVNSNIEVYSAGTETFTLTNPIKEGYIFAGWSGTDITSTSKNVSIRKGSYGDRAYEAKWNVANYTITYDFAGGAASESCVSGYTIESNNISIGAPIRTGYSFLGWSQTFQNFTWKTGKLVEGFYEYDANYYVSSPILLRAGSTYIMNANGDLTNIEAHLFGAEQRIFRGNINVGDRQIFSPGGPVFVYFVVTGEFLEAAYRDSISITVEGVSDTPDTEALHTTVEIPTGSTGNLKLKAHWAPMTYNITYNLNDGYYEQLGSDGDILEEGDEGYVENYNPNPTTFTVETPDFTLVNPVRAGYSFHGWKNAAGVISPTVKISQGSTEDREYSAQWTETLYTIGYDLGGGSIVEGINKTGYYMSTETFTLINPVRTGYTFGGWTGTGITGTSSQVTIEQGSSGNRFYLATWTPDTYNITYLMFGGTNAATNPNTYTFETETFTLAHPTKTGAIFSGWTGTGLSSPSMTVTIPKGSTGDKTYTANWSVSSYLITYNLAGGTESTNPSTYTVDTPTFTLAEPTRIGYIFEGWEGTGLDQPTQNVTIQKGSTGNRNYTATWSTNKYVINYTLGNNAQLGVANPTTYTIESQTITLNNPVRAGYAFSGWSGTDIDTTNGFAQIVTIPKGSTGNRYYVANWTIEEYRITYALNGGEAIGNPTTYTINSPTFTLNEPTKTGYIFTAWSGTGITGTGLEKVVIVPTGSTGNRTYTANWEIIKYTITYDLDGGSENIANPREYNYHSSPITLHNPVKPGFEFVGWVDSAEDGAIPSLSVTIPTNSIGDRYFLAKWEEGKYDITYDLDGGKWQDGYTPVDSYTYATETFEIDVPVKEGYIFAGWSGTGISGTTTEIVVYQGSAGDRSYVAHWAESENIISYDLAGGTVSGEQNPTSYVTGSGTIILNNPVKSGYRFAGWIGTGLTEPTKEVVIDTENGGALEFTATWTEISYKVTYVLGGGALESGVTNPTTYTVNDQFTLNNPTRTGYTFKGWSGTELEGTQPVVTVIAGSIGARRYTAVWEETVYTIDYDYGNGSVEFANPTTYQFTTPSFTLNNPECAGYNFIGWTGTDLTDETMTVIVEKGSVGNRTYSAKYDIVEYTIKYLDITGATFTAPATTYTVDDEIAIPNPTKVGYTFIGWSGTGIIGYAKDVVISEGSTGNRVYTANFVPVNYSISYDLQLGRVSGINPESYTIESADFSILNPGRAGYSFGGWTLSIVDFIWYNGTINSDGNVVQGAGYYSMPVSLRANTTYTFDSSLKLAIYNVDGTFVELANTGTYTASDDYICSVVVSGDVTEDYLKSVVVTVSDFVSLIEIPRGNLGSLSLTANWTSEKFTITYYLNGGALESGVTNPTEYTAETEGFSLNNPTRTGYEFVGWSGTDLTNAAVAVYVPAGSTGNRIYTANWRLERYYLNLDLAGGSFLQTVPQYFTVDTATFSLPIPVRSGYTFTGWLDDEGNLHTTVTIEKGTVGSKTYVAQWADNGSATGTHRIYYHGFNNQIIGYQDVMVGATPTGISYQVVIGYQFAGWSVSLSDPSVVDSTEDVHIYSTYKIGPDIYKITINDGSTETTKEYSQYATVRATAAEKDSNNNTFSHWEDENGSVVSYYRTFSFKAHTDIKIIAVYGTESTGDKVATRISKVETNDSHKWISFYAERSVATEYKIIQHGVMFTDDQSIAADSDLFVIGKEGVYVSSASSTSRSGVYTLSIGGLTQDGKTPYSGCDTIYARSYIKYSDANDETHVVYSDVVSQANVYKTVSAQ